jgi:DNA-binding NtrC family response regulator
MVSPVVPVVDDEPGVRALLRRSIAREARDIMTVTPASMLVCDINMTGHDRFRLIEHVRATRPETSIIMASGGADAFHARGRYPA